MPIPFFSPRLSRRLVAIINWVYSPGRSGNRKRNHPEKRWPPQLQEPQKAPKLWPWGVLLLTAKASATPPVYRPTLMAADAPPRLSAVCLMCYSVFLLFRQLTSRHWLLPFVVCSTRCHVLFMVFLPGRRIPLGHPHPRTHPHPAHGISLRMHIGLLYSCCVINLMAGKCEHTGIPGVRTRCNCQFARNSEHNSFWIYVKHSADLGLSVRNRAA